MISSLAIIAFAALIHASFQLSVSVFTLFSGHTIGAKTAQTKVLRLTTGFLFGALVMTMLTVSFTSFIFQNLFTQTTPQVIWAASCGLLLGLGIAVWVFYYRKGKGTSLWLPREMARHLSDRAKSTRHSAEAFSLGLSSVLGEALFIIAPIIVASLALIRLEPLWQLVGIALYTVISLLSLLVVYALVGSGHKLSRIQAWRENNKRFLQFTAGGGLLVLGFYIYVDQVLASTVMALHGGF
jgi:hypothetical protein